MLIWRFVGKATTRLPFFITAAVLSLFVSLNATTVRASDNRYTLASQNDFGAKRGFYVNFENSAEGEAASQLATLKLFLGVGDGKEMRFLSVAPRWEMNRDYTVRAVISPSIATLSVSENKTGAASPRVSEQAQSAGGFAPLQGFPLIAGERPGWASGRGAYHIRQTGLTITISEPGGTSPASSGKPATGVVRVPFPPVKARPAPVFEFEPIEEGKKTALAFGEGATLTIVATCRIEPALTTTELKTFAPLVDRWGQSRHAVFPGKVEKDADLMEAARVEDKQNAVWGAPKGYDAYGGLVTKGNGWPETATGFYRTVRKNGVWWLVTPSGNPAFYTGLCTAPALAWEKTAITNREWMFAELPPKDDPELWGGSPWGEGDSPRYAAIHTMNLIRKYGKDDWRAKASASLAKRLPAWGFSGLGKWTDPVGKAPLMPVLGGGDTPKLTRHIDVWDEAVRKTFVTALEKQIAPRKNDPTVLGWSFGNEYDEIVTSAEIAEIFKSKGTSPGANALRAWTTKTIYQNDDAKRQAAWTNGAPPQADLEPMRRHYADRYYAFIYETVKQLDPNHLYFGFWIVPGWWENDEDWRLSAKYCDVIGYDRYAATFADEKLLTLFRETDKPTLCGEFSFPPFYGGERAYGRYAAVFANTEAHAGDLYAKWIADASRNPHCVGAFWFQYRDQPITGRGPGMGDAITLGEHYAFGLVDITDRPKWPLVRKVREANLSATAQRLAAGKR